MSNYYVKRECWQRWPNKLIMVHETDDGIKRQVRFIPEKTTHLRFDGVAVNAPIVVLRLQVD